MRFGQLIRHGLRPTGRALLWLALGVGWLWALLAIWFFAPWPVWLQVVVAIAWVAATPWCFVRLTRPAAARVIAIGVLGVALLWSWQRPANERRWTPDQSRLPVARFDGDLVTIDNLRYTTYRSAADYDVTWYRGQYDLKDIERVDFVIEPFASWRGPAHTLLTFGFADGTHVAVSVEIRKERGESYSPLRGMFKNYEIMYVAGDERDLIGLQLEVRNSPVYLYPIKANREQVRALFVAVFERANRLAQQPEFYNTLTNTCTTNIVWHFEDLTGESLPLDFRILLPGYSDTLAFELGLVDTQSSSANRFEENRERFRVAAGADLDIDVRSWSRQIRRATDRE